MKTFYFAICKLLILLLIFTEVTFGKKLSKRSVAIGDDNYKWNKGIIMYKIEEKENFTSSRLLEIFKAMRHWEASTCIKFIELNSSIAHPDFINFRRNQRNECDSSPGQYYNLENSIRLADSCTYQDIIRQLGHIIGLYYEHQRPDRDDYVKVNDVNIQSSHEYDFEKLKKENVRTFGFPYDFNSIMQVGSKVGARNKLKDTLTPVKEVDGKVPVIGEAKGASEIDTQVVNLLYDCPKCGETIQKSAGKISSSENGDCEWQILAPQGHKIDFLLTSLDSNCSTDYLKIIDGVSDSSRLLGKFCGAGSKSSSLHSRGNRMLVKYRNSVSAHKGFIAQYQVTCNHTIFVDGKTVHLESPNFPEPYKPNQQCFWRLVAPQNHQLSVNLRVVQLENKKENCSLKFDDGSKETSACDFYYESRRKYLSTGNYLNVSFTPRESGQGFYISVDMKLKV